jgi:predicted  nucleic acid-binding Zn-ribbon protein
LASSAAYAIYISEVAEAKNQIPDVPAIISETQAAQTKADRKIAALERELTKTKERQRQARADLSITNHKLTKLADGKPHTSTSTVEIETSTTIFALRDLSPEAASTLRAFANECVDAKDGAPLWFGTPQGHA